MIDQGKENVVSVQQALHKRILTFRQKNKVMMQTIEKEEKKQKQNEKSFQKMVSKKNSQKYVGNKNPEIEQVRND